MAYQEFVESFRAILMRLETFVFHLNNILSISTACSIEYYFNFGSVFGTSAYYHTF